MKATGLLTLAALTLFALAAPSPAQAGCRCAAAVHSTIDAPWGLASDCTAAYNQAVANAEEQISCDVCAENIVTLTQCTPKDPVMMPGIMRVDVRIDYRCYICIGPLTPNEPF